MTVLRLTASTPPTLEQQESIVETRLPPPSPRAPTVMTYR